MSPTVQVTPELGLLPDSDAMDLEYVPLDEVTSVPEDATGQDLGFEGGRLVIDAGGEQTVVEDTLRYLVVGLCLRSVPALLADGAFTYRFFDFVGEVRLVVDGDRVHVTGDEVRPVTCPRAELLAAFVAAGEQLVDVMPRLLPGYEAYLDTVRPALAAAREALAGS